MAHEEETHMWWPVAHGEEVGNAQGGGRRWGLTVVRLWRKGDAAVEGHAGKPWPSWGKGKGERGGDDKWVLYVRSVFFLVEERVDGEVVGSPTF